MDFTQPPYPDRFNLKSADESGKPIPNLVPNVEVVIDNNIQGTHSFHPESITSPQVISHNLTSIQPSGNLINYVPSTTVEGRPLPSQIIEHPTLLTSWDTTAMSGEQVKIPVEGNVLEVPLHGQMAAPTSSTNKEALVKPERSESLKRTYSGTKRPAEGYLESNASKRPCLSTIHKEQQVLQPTAKITMASFLKEMLAKQYLPIETASKRVADSKAQVKAARQEAAAAREEAFFGPKPITTSTHRVTKKSFKLNEKSTRENLKSKSTLQTADTPAGKMSSDHPTSMVEILFNVNANIPREKAKSSRALVAASLDVMTKSKNLLAMLRGSCNHSPKVNSEWNSLSTAIQTVPSAFGSPSLLRPNCRDGFASSSASLTALNSAEEIGPLQKSQAMATHNDSALGSLKVGKVEAEATSEWISNQEMSALWLVSPASGSGEEDCTSKCGDHTTVGTIQSEQVSRERGSSNGCLQKPESVRDSNLHPQKVLIASSISDEEENIRNPDRSEGVFSTDYKLDFPEGAATNESETIWYEKDEESELGSTSGFSMREQVSLAQFDLQDTMRSCDDNKSSTGSNSLSFDNRGELMESEENNLFGLDWSNEIWPISPEEDPDEDQSCGKSGVSQYKESSHFPQEHEDASEQAQVEKIESQQLEQQKVVYLGPDRFAEHVLERHALMYGEPVDADITGDIESMDDFSSDDDDESDDDREKPGCGHSYICHAPPVYMLNLPYDFYTRTLIPKMRSGTSRDNALEGDQPAGDGLEGDEARALAAETNDAVILTDDMTLEEILAKLPKPSDPCFKEPPGARYIPRDKKFTYLIHELEWKRGYTRKQSMWLLGKDRPGEKKMNTKLIYMRLFRHINSLTEEQKVEKLPTWKKQAIPNAESKMAARVPGPLEELVTRYGDESLIPGSGDWEMDCVPQWARWIWRLFAKAFKLKNSIPETPSQEAEQEAQAELALADLLTLASAWGLNNTWLENDTEIGYETIGFFGLLPTLNKDGIMQVEGEDYCVLQLLNNHIDRVKQDVFRWRMEKSLGMATKYGGAWARLLKIDWHT